MIRKDDSASYAEIGEWAHALAADLWSFPRSLTGIGVRKTLDRLSREIDGLQRYQVPTGYRAFDWAVPNEWNLNRAWIETPDGSVICDTDVHNLHVVGYSVPCDVTLGLAELKPHLYSQPDLADAIPYVTSYYNRDWGFCITENEKRSLGDGRYRAVVDATLEPGHLEYADVVIPGERNDEILFSTYLCHPSMANNELSGLVTVAALARMVAAMPERKYTYRFIFVPETIGALVYLSDHLDHLKRSVMAGFVVTCVGDERARSYMPSRWGNTLADKVALAALEAEGIEFETYTFLERGSDERQFCAPGVDLPFCSVMASKYGTFPEYHTSADDLEFVTPKGLAASFSIYWHVINLLEEGDRPRASVLGEPQLGRRGLYSALSRKGSSASSRLYLNVLAYSDGSMDTGEMSKLFGVSHEDVKAAVAVLRGVELLR